MVQILGLQQGAMHSAGECWRYTKLCELVDVSANGFVVPMTGWARDARHTSRAFAALSSTLRRMMFAIGQAKGIGPRVNSTEHDH